MKEERKSENLRVRDGLGDSRQGQDGWGERASGVGDWCGWLAWVIAGEKQQKRDREYTREKKERKRKGTRAKGIRR